MKIETHSLEQKPKYKNGDTVTVDFSKFGNFPEDSQKEGKILGRAIQGPLDFWIVDFGSIISEEYPYQSLSVQHTFIIKE